MQLQQPSISIADYWPPAPGPNQTNTGWKQRSLHLTAYDPHVESLANLHRRNWWSGVRIDADLPAGATLRCRIIAGPIVLSDWLQTANVWTAFPALLSADMSDREDLCLKVTLLGCANDVFATMRICWHELD